MLHTHCGLVHHRAPPRGAARADRRPTCRRSSRPTGSRSPTTPTPSLGASLADALAAHADAADPGLEPDVDSIWALIFTSGTSDAPKAVICSQRRLLVTGNRMTMIMDIGPDDVGYVCMPLFHSNAVQVGWAPSFVTPCAVGLGPPVLGVAVARPTSATTARRTSTTPGKPLAYLLAQPERADDADNTLRVAFGNEGSPEVVDNFSRRFGVEVIDAYGATEGGVAVNRDVDMPPGALGHAPDHVQVVDDDGKEKARAELDDRGRVRNAEECVGEIVNTQGVGPFEGYYNNDDATAKTTRFGWYWSGDLGYKDADGFLYFAGRNADWIRVDGENFPAGPIEEALRKAPGVVLAAVYGVPDDQAGDQVMAGLVLADGAEFDPTEFARLARRAGRDRAEVAAALRADPARPADHRYQQDREAHARAPEVPRRPCGRRRVLTSASAAKRSSARSPATDEAVLHASFVHYGRERFWDL